MTANFDLSVTLPGHEMDVKDIASWSSLDGSILLCSASRDRSVLCWVKPSTETREYKVHRHYRQIHSHFVNALAVYPPSEQHPCGLIVSAGNDKTILVSDPLSAAPQDSPSEPLYHLIGHKENVCTLTVSKSGQILSGSWDRTIKIWDNFVCVATLEGHEHAVWCVRCLDDGQILSASADKTIKLWKNGKCIKTFTGHSDVVRGLVILDKDTFASSSNDGTLRIWNLNGECTKTLIGHTSFVYQIKKLPSGELVSCGEDRTVRVWKGEYCVQTLHLPCVSVWCVDVLPNGDIACGGNDGLVRVFSRQDDRKASTQDILAFDAAVAKHAIPVNQVGDVDKTKLPGLEALERAGSKNGQVIMVRNGNLVEAHQWDGSTWQKIGEVVDAVGQAKKTMFNNQEYDYVFDIDIGDGVPPLKLPYNVTENPYQTAQNFIHQHELPQGYLDQIANFIITNAKGNEMVLGGGTAQNADPFTGGSRYVPQGSTAPVPPPVAPQKSVMTFKYIPMSEYVPFKVANISAIFGKMKQINQDLEKSAAGPSMTFSSNELEQLDTLMSALTQNESGTSTSLTPHQIQVVKKAAMCWPDSQKFPALDVLRICLLYSSVPLNDEGFVPLLLNVGFSSSQDVETKFKEANAMFALRALCNMFLSEQGKTRVHQHIHSIFDTIRHAWHTTNVNVRVAFITCVVNLCVLLQSTSDDTIKLELLAELVQFLQKESDSEAAFRAMSALGTLIHRNDLLKDAAISLDLHQVITGLAKQIPQKDGRLQDVATELSGLMNM